MTQNNVNIYVDADACPVIREVEEIASKYKLKTILICDTSHIITSEYSDVIIADRGSDSVDIVLINKCRKGDIVVTQDYGVGAMALGKCAYAIHQSGKWYTDDNIDSMLMSRHIVKSARHSHKKIHIKGQSKRTEKDNAIFLESFEKLVLKAVNERDKV